MLTPLTLYILLGVTVILIAYDIYAYLKHDGSTISETLYAAAKRYPVIPFFFGMLASHFFWNV